MLIALNNIFNRNRFAVINRLHLSKSLFWLSKQNISIKHTFRMFVNLLNAFDSVACIYICFVLNTIEIEQ